MKNELFQIRMSQTEKEQLLAVAEKQDKPASQIVREAVREKIAELLNEEPDQKKTVLAA